MKWIDLHCDTILAHAFGKATDLYQTSSSLDFLRMKQADSAAQFFAVCRMPQAIYQQVGVQALSDRELLAQLTGRVKECVAAHPELIAMAYNADDLQRNLAQGRMSAFLTAEDGNYTAQPGGLREMYDMGIRLITLTWNQENDLGYPNSTDAELMGKGLKEKGREVVEQMQELGMIVDVSHLSDGGFWDVASMAKRPFIASHSNARALTPHPRNLTDEMIAAVAEHGGIIGINYAAEFVSEDITSRKSTIADIVRHTRYLCDKGGVESVALGGDLDGIFGDLEIDSVDKVPLLFDALAKAGLHESEIERIAFRNAERVIRDCMA